MKKTILLALATLLCFSGTFVQAQVKTAVISTATATYGNFVTTVSGKRATNGEHEITNKDLIEVSVYEPSETQDARLPKGQKYNVFVISRSTARDPQSILYFATDKPAWQDALRAAGSFKVTGLGVLGAGKKNKIKKNDYYRLSAQQDKENGPINITFDVFRMVNGKQKSVATFSADTKPMKWPI